MKLICQHSPFLHPRQIISQVNAQLLNAPQQALPTANNNSSVSAHENLIQSYLIFDRHTYCLPILFYFWFFLFYYLLENVKLLNPSCPGGKQQKGKMWLSSRQCLKRDFEEHRDQSQSGSQPWKQFNLKAEPPGCGPRACRTNIFILFQHFPHTDVFWEGLKL